MKRIILLVMSCVIIIGLLPMTGCNASLNNSLEGSTETFNLVLSGEYITKEHNDFLFKYDKVLNYKFSDNNKAAYIYFESDAFVMLSSTTDSKNELNNMYASSLFLNMNGAFTEFESIEPEPVKKITVNDADAYRQKTFLKNGTSPYNGDCQMDTIVFVGDEKINMISYLAPSAKFDLYYDLYTEIVNSLKSIESDKIESSSEQPKEDKIQRHYSGTYKIGADLAPGTYLIQSSTASSNYFEVTSNSSGEFESIITNDNFYNRTYITVEDGQYLSFESGYAILAEDAPAYDPADGYYPSGMYLVGKDIPAGEYKISVQKSSYSDSGYYEVTSDASGILGSIITNNNIKSDTYQALSDGQYIKMDMAYININ